MKKLIIPVLWVVVYQAVSAYLGIMTTAQIDTWYNALNKPALMPPNYLFGIVWPVLYILIALTGYFSWKNRKATPLIWFLFIAYTLFNWAWSPIFFGAHMVFTGLICIILVNATNLAIIVKSWKGNRKIAYLMIPPIFWTLFATYLNYMIWALN